jgi:hypothetical protein
MQSWSFIHARRTVGMGAVGSLEMTLPSLESLPLCMLAGHAVHTATQQRNVNDGGHYEQKATEKHAHVWYMCTYTYLLLLHCSDFISERCRYIHACK